MGARVPGIRDVPRAAQTEGRRRPLRDGRGRARERPGWLQFRLWRGRAALYVRMDHPADMRLDRTAWTSS